MNAAWRDIGMLDKRGKALWALLVVAGLLFLMNCGNGDGDGDGAGSPAAAPLAGLGPVGPLYRTNGADWNDYVSSDGADALSASDKACDPDSDGPGHDGCINGGPMRLALFGGPSSCTGITAADGLGAFEWTCIPGVSYVRIVSTGLKVGKGLSDLIDFSGPDWRANSLTVYQGGTAAGSTTPAVWWSNPVLDAGSGGYLATEGAVYAVTSPSSDGITVGADRMSFVIDPAVTMGVSSGVAAFYAYGRDFLWLEGDTDCTGTTSYGIYLGQVRFSVVSGVSVSGASSTGLYMTSSDSNLVSGAGILNAGARGLEVSGSHWNTIGTVSVASTGMQGVFISGSDRNRFSDLRAANTGLTSPGNGSAIHLFASSYNTFDRVLASNSRLHGLHISKDFSGNPSSFNSFFGLTATGNEYAGVSVACPNNALSGVTAAGNKNGSLTAGLYMGDNGNMVQEAAMVDNAYGLIMSGLYNSTFNNVAVSNSTGYGASFGLDTSYVHFTGVLKVGNSGTGYDCYDLTPGSGLAPGLVNDTCTTSGLDGSGDYGIGNTSDATYYVTFNPGGSFGGRVTTDDTGNISDAAGSSAYSVTMDWTAFERQERAWGLEGTMAFPPVGSCEASDTCRIWDWSLSSADTVMKGLPLHTAGAVSNTVTHAWHSPVPPMCQADCDSGSFPGSAFSSGQCKSTFLRNAVELPGRGGNGNFLCESGETCLHTPNMGAYQGHGTLTGAGDFADGVLTGITLMKYGTNGY